MIYRLRQRTTSDREVHLIITCHPLEDGISGDQFIVRRSHLKRGSEHHLVPSRTYARSARGLCLFDRITKRRDREADVMCGGTEKGVMDAPYYGLPTCLRRRALFAIAMRRELDMRRSNM
jgi:hypothetical protein